MNNSQARIQPGDHTVAHAQAGRLLSELHHLPLGPAGQAGRTFAPLPGGPHPSPAREGIFHFAGYHTWLIGLDGNVHLYCNALGLHQLHHLLQRPGQRVPVIDVAEVRGQKVVVNQLCEEDIADDKALAQWKGQINSLRDQLEIAKETGNSERAAALEVESEALTLQISCAQSHRGIRRRLGDQGDKLRKRVSYTLRSSLKQIGRQSPDLGEHLKASIKMGFDCGYIPQTAVRWTL